MSRLRALLALPFLAQPAAAQEAVLPETVIRAQRLDAARDEISPSLGATTTTIGRGLIEGLPQGANAGFNQVLYQIPGAAVDSFGELHLRGEHRGLQFRLNGITLPEGIQGFGSFLDARSVEQVQVLRGALPAQFGYRLGGVVDLTLRSPSQGEGGRVSLYGGSRGLLNPSFDYARSVAGWDLFATGSYQRSDQGIEAPQFGSTLSNRTEQWRGLVYLSRAIDERTRISLISGASNNRFQIPASAGTAPQFTAFGVAAADSADVRARQRENNQFNILALQTGFGDVDAQIALFTRHSQLRYHPDTLRELIFNGVASNVTRESFSAGLQADAAWRLHPRHTLRFGLSVVGERTRAANNATVLPLDPFGAAIDAPFTIRDARARTGWLYGLYVQDEWRIADRLTLNMGLRFDHLDGYSRESAVSPRVNLVWLPMDGTRVSLGYMRTFVPPAQELIATGNLLPFAGTTAEPQNFTSSPVRAERAHYFNLGIQQRLTENVTVGVGAYYKHATNLLDLGQFGNALVFTPFNYAQGRAYGVEFTAAWRSARLDAYANLALSRSIGRRITSGQFNFDAAELAFIESRFVRTDHDQMITASAGFVYRGWEGGRISGTVLAGSGLRRGFANTEKMAPYGTMNIGIAQDFQGPDGGRWTVRGDILNLLDTRVQLRDGSGIGVGAPQFLARRGFYAGLSRAF